MDVKKFLKIKSKSNRSSEKVNSYGPHFSFLTSVIENKTFLQNQK